MSTKEAESIRHQVAATYTRAVTREKDDCGCCCGTESKGVASRVAGYGAEELSTLPADAVVSSFGCGNPLAFAGVRAGETVVDLGSGAGIDILLAAERVGPEGRVIGVDMTDEMVERARRNAADSGATQVDVRLGLIEQLPVEDSSADWVISNCVINLSPEKERVFAEIHRVLKPGGRFSISDIVVEWLPDWVRESPSFYSACVAGAISEQRYLDGLRQAGLDELEVTERIVYTGAQMKALLESEEVPGVEGLGKEALADLAETLEGQIWSAKICGRKPL